MLPEFKYTSEDDLDGMMVTGNLDSYTGGGYVFNLKGPNKDLRFYLLSNLFTWCIAKMNFNCRAKLKTLQNQKWVNNHTRAVLLGK